MRQSGVLLHITSLPGPYGIGTMGQAAREFVDFLQAAGQSLWQVLPLTPTGYGDSPYQSCSAYAGNPYLIDLDLLVQEGLLERQEIEPLDWCETENRVDYGRLYRLRWAVLKKAFYRFVPGKDFEAFRRENSHWLSDFCLYMALKDAHGGKAWYQWPEPLKLRDPDAIWQARQTHQETIRFYRFVQYLFHRQWTALRSYASEKGVKLIGDVPIYVPLDSADVWANPELFQLNERLEPVNVAGVPPDAFQADGQLWGNPLYRWDLHQKDGFSWWIRRLRSASERYDYVRMDHFRGLAGYWSVPAQDGTAQNGRWCKGPGMAFVKAVRQQLPDISMIAEDLGYLTEDVLALRDASGWPGMKVLGFAFDSREPNDYLPHTYEKNAVCYTGTHDNMTTRQWFDTASADAVAYAREYMHLNAREGLVWGVIRTAMASVCDMTIVPMQDYLDLGAEARMNFPGTAGSHNWTWRAKEGCLTRALARRIRRLTKLYGR